jgi:PAS domain S-box-containing protein
VIKAEGISMLQTEHFSRNTTVATPELPLAALQQLAGEQGSAFWELLAGVFDNLRQGILVADATGRVVVYNKVAQQILGYSHDEVAGRVSLWDFCEECRRPPLFRESILRGQSFAAEEVEMSSKYPGNPVGVRVTPLYTQDGTLAGAMATLRSLEEIRARERERKNLVRLASIGRIISSVAHEINNPLQTVRTSLELGLDPRKSPAKRQAYLHAADLEITRITRVIGQMRNFYRPDMAEKRPTDVNTTIHEALALLEKQLHAQNVRVALELTEDLPNVSLVDYQLEQVFLNLILNALEEMPQGGELLISTALDNSGQVMVAFRDSAMQLDAAQAASLFDPFGSHRRAGELALGLSVSREIITELGGTIEMHTEQGNTLVVRLPCQ